MRANWKRAPLVDLCQNLDSKRVPITESKRVKGDIPYYGASGPVDYVREFIFDESLLLVSEDGANLLARTYPIAFSIVGKSWVNNHAHALRFAEPATQKFVEYYLNSISLARYVTGMAQPKLTQKALNSIVIPVPPLFEQQCIVTILDETFAGLATATANAEKNLKNARELFDSYLNSIFEDKNKGWHTRPLEELCENDRVITYGVIKLGKESTSGVPCLRTSNVRWLRIDTDGIKRISLALSNEYRRTILRGGEVLVNVRGTLGGVAVAAQDMKGWNVSREVAVVPVDRRQIEPDYLAYFIATRRSQNWLTDMQKGLAYVGINIADLRTLPISCPSKEMQIQLIEQFQKLSGESRRLEAVYADKRSKIDELRRAILKAAFSGELTSPPSQAIKEAAE